MWNLRFGLSKFSYKSLHFPQTHSFFVEPILRKTKNSKSERKPQIEIP